MKLNNPNYFYSGGILAERHRERTRNVPVRYRHFWSVHRVAILGSEGAVNFDRFTTLTDDSGVRVSFARTEQLGGELSKRQAIEIVNRNATA